MLTIKLTSIEGHCFDLGNEEREGEDEGECFESGGSSSELHFICDDWVSSDAESATFIRSDGVPQVISTRMNGLEFVNPTINHACSTHLCLRTRHGFRHKSD